MSKNKKKNTKKKKTADDDNTNNEDQQQPNNSMSPEAQAVLEMMRRQTLQSGSGSGSTIQQVIPLGRDANNSNHKKHAFWDTQVGCCSERVESSRIGE
jgi:hypothetical protein